MSENGQITTEVAKQVIEAVAAQGVGKAPDRRPWLHPDAMMPLDYIRGKKMLAAQLKERSHDSCYDFLGTEDMYPFLIWAIKSRDNPAFTWDDALRTPFYEFKQGADERPQILPLESSGRSGSTPSGSGSTRRRPRPVPVPSSASSSDSPEPNTTG